MNALIPSSFQVCVQLILNTILFLSQTELVKLRHIYRNLHEVTYPERVEAGFKPQRGVLRPARNTAHDEACCR